MPAEAAARSARIIDNSGPNPARAEKDRGAMGHRVDVPGRRDNRIPGSPGQRVGLRVFAAEVGVSAFQLCRSNSNPRSNRARARRSAVDMEDQERVKERAARPHSLFGPLTESRSPDAVGSPGRSVAGKNPKKVSHLPGRCYNAQRRCVPRARKKWADAQRTSDFVTFR